MNGEKEIGEASREVLPAEIPEDLVKEGLSLLNTTPEKAVSILIKAVQESREKFNFSCEAEACRQLGKFFLRNSDYLKAFEYAIRGVELFKELELPGEEADCLNVIGGVYNYLGDHEMRLATNLRCVQLRKLTTDREDLVASLNNLGDTYNRLGKHKDAERTFLECYNMDNLAPRTRCILTHNLGETRFFLNDFSGAREWFEKSIPLARETGYEAIFIVGNLFLARIQGEAAELDSAETFAEMALQQARKGKFEEEEVEALKILSEIAEKKGERERAFQLFKEFFNKKEEVFGTEKMQEIRNVQFQHMLESLKNINNSERERNSELSRAIEQIKEQRNLITLKNKAITDSIFYASRLQNSLVSNETDLQRIFKKSFLLNIPKDIVSGDFFWVREKNGFLYLAVADCTGHGVPGALMSVLGVSQLDHIMALSENPNPGEILNKLSQNIATMMNRHEGEEKVRDGMDIGIIRLDMATGTCLFSAAFSGLTLVNKGGLSYFNGNRIPLGSSQENDVSVFEDIVIPTQPADVLYLYSDGFSDQFGGAKGKKLKSKEFRKLLFELAKLSPAKRKASLESIFSDWKGGFEQTDDIMVLGLEL